MIVPVYVDGWQLECCGKPFAVGDSVAWSLELRIDTGVLPDDCCVDDSRVKPDTRGTADGHLPGANASVDGMAVWSAPDEDMRTSIRQRHLLTADWHGGVPEELPASSGVVRRIRLVTQPYESTDGIEWVPAPIEPELSDLDRSPSQFRFHRPPETRLAPNETGLVVDLDVAAKKKVGNRVSWPPRDHLGPRSPYRYRDSNPGFRRERAAS